MYAVEVRDHVMIAHSLKGEVFGPAQKLHGATYVTDVCFMRQRAGRARYRGGYRPGHRNREEGAGRAEFQQSRRPCRTSAAKPISTTWRRWRAGFSSSRCAAAIAAGRLGPSAKGIERLKITLARDPTRRAPPTKRISILPELWFAVPGDPDTLTGGYIYANRLSAALGERGWRVHRLALPAGFPISFGRRSRMPIPREFRKRLAARRARC